MELYSLYNCTSVPRTDVCFFQNCRSLKLLVSTEHWPHWGCPGHPATFAASPWPSAKHCATCWTAPPHGGCGTVALVCGALTCGLASVDQSCGSQEFGGLGVPGSADLSGQGCCGHCFPLCWKQHGKFFFFFFYNESQKGMFTLAFGQYQNGITDWVMQCKHSCKINASTPSPHSTLIPPPQ